MSEPLEAKAGDLWGAEFDPIPPSTPLVSVLQEQARILTNRTNGRIVGEVSIDAGIDIGTVWTSLFVRVPALLNYRRKLLSLAYPVEVDPLNPFPVTTFDYSESLSRELRDMDEYCEWLREILSSSEIHGLIANLLHYSQEKAAS